VKNHHQSIVEYLAERFKFLDLLKGYAVIMMIQGHTISAVLVPEAKETAFYQFLHILRGLTAPAFLIASGCGLAFSISRKREANPLKVLLYRMMKIFPILVIGYFLHLPRFSLYQLLTQSSRQEIIQFFQCDILQTIGWSVIILQIFLTFIRDRRLIIFFTITGLLSVLYFTPQVNNWVSSPNFFTQLLTPNFGSNFPLFPFSAYLLLGFFFGLEFYELQKRTGIKNINRAIFVIGLVFFSASFFIKNSNFSLFLFRTGSLILFMSLFLTFERVKNRIVSFFVVIGQESLLIYFVHLIIVYGSALNKGFIHYWKENLNTELSIVLANALIVVMLGMGYLWHSLKEENPVACRVLRNCLSALLFVKFLTNW